MSHIADFAAAQHPVLRFRTSQLPSETPEVRPNRPVFEASIGLRRATAPFAGFWEVAVPKLLESRAAPRGGGARRYGRAWRPHFRRGVTRWSCGRLAG
jgi:hypothetical protein